MAPNSEKSFPECLVMALGTEPGLKVSGCWLWVWSLGVTVGCG